MSFSKKTGVILAVLISAVSYTTTACNSEPELERLVQVNPQVNPVANEAVVTGEILGIEDERVSLLVPEGETREILIPRSEIERLDLLPERLITAALDPNGRATEVRLGEVAYAISTNTPEAAVVAPVNSESALIAQAQSPAVVAPVNPEPASIAQAQSPAVVAPVNPEPASIAQAQLPGGGAPVNPEPASIAQAQSPADAQAQSPAGAQAQSPADPPTSVRALW